MQSKSKSSSSISRGATKSKPASAASSKSRGAPKSKPAAATSSKPAAAAKSSSKSRGATKAKPAAAPTKRVLGLNDGDDFKTVIQNANSIDAIHENIRDGKAMVVLIFSDRCSFCQILRPSWDEFKRRRPNIDVVEVSSDYMRETPRGQNMFMDVVHDNFEGSVPQIFMYHDDVVRPYRGDRSSSDLTSFASS
jgi:hypothetical protein